MKYIWAMSCREKKENDEMPSDVYVVPSLSGLSLRQNTRVSEHPPGRSAATSDFPHRPTDASNGRRSIATSAPSLGPALSPVPFSPQLPYPSPPHPPHLNGEMDRSVWNPETKVSGEWDNVREMLESSDSHYVLDPEVEHSPVLFATAAISVSTLPSHRRFVRLVADEMRSRQSNTDVSREGCPEEATLGRESVLREVVEFVANTTDSLRLSSAPQLQPIRDLLGSADFGESEKPVALLRDVGAVSSEPDDLYKVVHNARPYGRIGGKTDWESGAQTPSNEPSRPCLYIRFSVYNGEKDEQFYNTRIGTLFEVSRDHYERVEGFYVREGTIFQSPASSRDSTIVLEIFPAKTDRFSYSEPLVNVPGEVRSLTLVVPTTHGHSEWPEDHEVWKDLVQHYRDALLCLEDVYETLSTMTVKNGSAPVPPVTPPMPPVPTPVALLPSPPPPSLESHTSQGEESVARKGDKEDHMAMVPVVDVPKPSVSRPWYEWLGANKEGLGVLKHRRLLMKAMTPLGRMPRRDYMLVEAYLNAVRFMEGRKTCYDAEFTQIFQLFAGRFSHVSDVSKARFLVERLRDEPDHENEWDAWKTAQWDGVDPFKNALAALRKKELGTTRHTSITFWSDTVKNMELFREETSWHSWTRLLRFARSALTLLMFSNMS